MSTGVAPEASAMTPNGGGPIPPLPDNATPQQKDEHWFRYHYQGDKVPQLTFRAVAMGAALGMLMSISNLYTVMKVGWSFGVAITSCVMSYVIWNLLRALTGGRLSPMSILENNCMQSTASAAGASTGLTIATAFGALLILDPQHQHQPWLVVASFTLATAAMGVFLAIPMKRQMINQEQLPFPSGIAAATTLRSLYSHGGEAVRQAYALITALAAGAIVGVLNTSEDMFVRLGKFFEWMRGHLINVHLPDLVPAEGLCKVGPDGALSRVGKPLFAFGFEPSVLLIGAGMIVGLRVSLSMLAASAALYFWAAPKLIAFDVAHGTDPGYVISIPLVAGGTIYHPVRWALWGGTAVMVFASLTSLAMQWRTIARSFLMFRKKAPAAPACPHCGYSLKGLPADVCAECGKALAAGRREAGADIEERMAAIEVPTSWMVIGLIPIMIAMLLVQSLAFQIGVLPGLLAIGMSFVLCMVACRAVGETDTNPIGAMGKVMQLMFALVSPGNVTHNLMSAGIGANAASSSADLLTDLKSGYLLGANPRKQFLAQFIGIFFGTLAIVPAWYLMIPNEAALQKYPLPATNTWVAVARVLSQGLHSLPETARWAILFGASIGVVLPVLEKLFPKARPYLPSAMGLGLGWVVFFNNAIAFSVGATITLLWGWFHRKSQERYNVPIASGLVAGESLIKALLAMLATGIGIGRDKGWW